jgi:VCBS repeat-containing protein
VTGNLAAADVDNGAVLAWTLEGGADVVGNVDYSFAIDKLTIVKNGAAIFTDDFGDGVAPPTGGLFTNGSVAEYGTSGVFTESGGRAIMDGSLAGPTQSALFTSIPFSGHTATLRTNRSDAVEDQNKGLKSDDNFTVEGQFDLVIPDENREGYGIRLSDRSGNDPGQQGDDVMELFVRRNANGDLKVSFRERDFEDGTVIAISSVTLDPPEEATQIVLRLDHDLDSPGAIAASFDFLDTNGVLIGSTVALPGTGQIFNGETWTRAQIVAFSPGEITSSSLEGDYGTISINADGQWTYDLDNDSALVQGLDEGQTLTDTFTAVVTDQYGASDTQEVTISITGTDEQTTALAIVEYFDEGGIYFDELNQVLFNESSGFAEGQNEITDVFVIDDFAEPEYSITGFVPTEDVLDLSALLSDTSFSDAAVADYVRAVDNGVDTTIQVDTDGAANGEVYVDLATLNGVTSADEINIVTTPLIS